MADRSQIEEIKDKLNILDVASDYIKAPFKRTGRNTFTLCPFHNEKSPSFSLNDELGIYKCFGCGESGDVITLIEKLEGVDFPKALEIAANKAGVTITAKLTPSQKKLADERKKVQEANTLAAEYYHYLLAKHDLGREARKYVRKRKIRVEEIKEFKIGYAPNGFENLKKYLTKKGFTEKELVNWGLLVEKNGRIYDKFRDRLMFPIFNHRGEIVGFSGRTLQKDGIPKYLNSPETLLYKKSHIIYGLYQAKEEIRRKNFAIIAEGNIEPLTSRKSDLGNVVVPMGTSLTRDQLKLIKRYTENLYFAFDSDTAGFSALQRAIKQALEEDFNIKAINLGKYKDPDEMIAEDPDIWKKAVENAVGFIDYLIIQYKSKLDLGTAEGKSTLVKELSIFLKLLSDQVQYEHYVKKIAKLLDISVDSINKSIQNNKSVEIKEKKELVVEVDNSLINYLLSLMINFPNIETDLDDIEFNDLQAKILKIKDMTNSISQIRDNLDEKEQNYFDSIVMLKIPDFDIDDAKKEIKKEIEKVRLLQTKNKIKALKERITEQESSGGDLELILKELKVLNSKLKKL